MNIPQSVFEVYKMNIIGNVIPHLWYKRVTFANGKPHLSAIIVLAEIVYWYRPIEVKDEATGQVIGLQKRFAADKLQKSYDALAEQFGLGKEEMRNACERLKEMGVIDLEFRTVGEGEKKANNVMFIGLNTKVLSEITYPSTPIGFKTDSPPLSVLKPIASGFQNRQPIGFETDTNTENTYREQTNRSVGLFVGNGEVKEVVVTDVEEQARTRALLGEIGVGPKDTNSIAEMVPFAVVRLVVGHGWSEHVSRGGEIKKLDGWVLWALKADSNVVIKPLCAEFLKSELYLRHRTAAEVEAEAAAEAEEKRRLDLLDAEMNAAEAQAAAERLQREEALQAQAQQVVEGSAEGLWAEALREIQAELTPTTYNSYFADTTARIDDTTGEWIVENDKAYVVKILQERFRSVIKRALTKASGQDVKVVLSRFFQQSRLKIAA